MLLFLAWTNITSLCSMLFGIIAVLADPDSMDNRIVALFTIASIAFTLSAIGLSIGHILTPS